MCPERKNGIANCEKQSSVLYTDTNHSSELEVASKKGKETSAHIKKQKEIPLFVKQVFKFLKKKQTQIHGSTHRAIFIIHNELRILNSISDF